MTLTTSSLHIHFASSISDRDDYIIACAPLACTIILRLHLYNLSRHQTTPQINPSNQPQCLATETDLATTAPSRVRTSSTATLATYVFSHPVQSSPALQYLQTTNNDYRPQPSPSTQRTTSHPLPSSRRVVVRLPTYTHMDRALTIVQLSRASALAAAATRLTRRNPPLRATRLRRSKPLPGMAA